MDFRIADTFTDSLAKLTGDEQKAVKTTAFDLQMNPANPGMSFHKLDKARDKNFWSVRVSSPVGVRFRQWANDKLKEYIVKGFVLDDACLKNPGKGRDYLDFSCSMRAEWIELPAYS